MNIRDAITQLVAVQGGLSITVPASVSVKKAWNYFPPQTTALSIDKNGAVWMNEWTLSSVDRHSALRVQNYTVHSQMLVAEPDMDRAADIATAFMDKYITDLDAAISLTNTVTQHNLRGGSPTLAIIPRGERNYVGLDLFLDIEMKEAATFAG